MFMSESYTKPHKEGLSKATNNLSWEAVSLYHRSLSESESSSRTRNGSSHDSGHDSYMEDCTGYSGDDEEVTKCDICACTSQGLDNLRLEEDKGDHRLRKKRKRKRKLMRVEEHYSAQGKDYGDTRFDFEGSASHEKKWTMEYYFDSKQRIHRLRRVVIARKGDENDLENMVVLDLSSDLAMASLWRREVLRKMKERNQRETMNFQLLPTTSSCDACIVKRGEKVKNRTSGELSVDKFVTDSDEVFPTRDDITERVAKLSNSKWRKKILYDLKFGNCQILSFLNSLRHREESLNGDVDGGHHMSEKPRAKSRSMSWETYEIISEEDTIL